MAERRDAGLGYAGGVVRQGEVVRNGWRWRWWRVTGVVWPVGSAVVFGLTLMRVAAAGAGRAGEWMEGGGWVAKASQMVIEPGVRATDMVGASGPVNWFW